MNTNVACRVRMVRSRLMRVASALAALGVVCCISPPGAEADALPPGYPAYIPVDQYYASQGLGLISDSIVFDEVITGNDNNGGYVLRETTWTTVYSEPSPVSINIGGYTANGYESAGLPISLQPGTSANLATQPPATKPLTKTDDQKAAWTKEALADIAEAAVINSLAPATCALLKSALAIEACVAAASAVATQLTTDANILLQFAADPTDLDYTQIATLASPPTLSVPDFPGLTPDESSAWSDFVQTLADTSVLLNATATSIDRADGAFESGAPQFWVDLQSEAFNGYDELDNAEFARLQTDANILGLNASAASVPEPATLTLLGSALLALLLVRPLHLVFLRRRRDASAVV